MQHDAKISQNEDPMTEAIDRFLGAALRAAIHASPLPTWPPHWPCAADVADAVFKRIAFHGIMLFLLNDPAKLEGWPASLRTAMGQEARAQTFWELGHRQVLTRLVVALGDARAGCVITKGTALAYSVYPDPATRRRGDSDLLLRDVRRKDVRRTLAANGFHPVGDKRPLQESWSQTCPMGFDHVFDLHWRINASPLLAYHLESAGVGSHKAPLPRLSDRAWAIAPADNLVLVAINRAAHGTFGYTSGDDKLFDRERLIWAVDFDLICRSLAPGDWDDLIAVVRASGTAPLVRSALAYAQRVLGTPIPDAVSRELETMPGKREVMRYFEALSGLDRLRLDFAASRTWGEKLHVARYTFFPGTEVLHERFADATHWPLPILQVRRLAGGLGRVLTGRP
ncbi:nucleotidyltransferase family protein [Erythrobacter sp. R86502]|uniref:nucleotidyltransferase family protein n=1 Tax=Erythrobacter sp. R86502 TaxID=3093846 RepID=UPI0036D2CB4E